MGLLFSQLLSSQDISFFHLNKSKGLSDNLVSGAVRDKSGLLWITTTEGLNCYDGYTVKKFYKEDYPDLYSNDLRTILCDEHNRLWIRHGEGRVTVMDENRKFHPVTIDTGNRSAPIQHVLLDPKKGILLLSGNRFFIEKKDFHFEELPVQKDSALSYRYANIDFFSKDVLLMSGNGGLCLFDLSTMRSIYHSRYNGIVDAARINDDELLITTSRTGGPFRYSISKNAVIKDYQNITDQYGERPNSYMRFIYRMIDGKFIISSGYAGVFIFDPESEKLYRYSHDPLDQKSVSANNTFYTMGDSSGFVFIATRTSGLNYFNTNQTLAGNRTTFKDEKTGTLFDGFVNCIAEDDQGNIWLGTQSRLIEWDRSTNKSRFHDYGIVDNYPLNGTEEVRALCFDRSGRLWVGVNRYGIIVLDKNRKPVRYIRRDSLSKSTLPGNWINQIIEAPDGMIWAATSGGACRINPVNFEVDDFSADPELNILKKKTAHRIWFRTSDEIWIGTTTGAYRYNRNEKSVRRYFKDNGLIGNNVLCFADDILGNMYIGTWGGFHKLRKDGSIEFHNSKNGLPNDHCKGMMRDIQGNIWISHDGSLVRYSPMGNSFRVFDAGLGLSEAGFRSYSYFQTREGELFWGNEGGVNYFFPQQLQTGRAPLQVIVQSFSAGEKNYFSPNPLKVDLAFNSNNLQFSFAAIDLYSSKNIFYEYKLEGLTDSWTRTDAPRLVAYGNLKPGNYTFKLRASRNGVDWVNAVNPVSITIQTPWWRTAWFITAVVLLVAALAFYLMQLRRRKILEQREVQETEQAIHHFASSLYAQGTVDDILWDVTRNCISHLNFEDCVIYLVNEETETLVQKAAWGPKTTHENKILNPLEIPVGNGIVGTVAKTGLPEIINDVSQDKRYIIDDLRRSAEITVPIISDGKVLGVIDSEHSRKNFFKQKHLSILTTIASLCANKIVRANAEAEKQRAEIELLQMQHHTAEVEMQALRAQMNPHFLFNSLNSINHFILKNDVDNASDYLTRFSRLMRLILDNSREEWVLLDNELKALQLYIQLEAVRLKNIFDYTIEVDPSILAESVMVPPMIIQPYVENAIWHGLLHRSGPGGKLKLNIWKTNGNLCIRIEDNGVGRIEATRLRSKFTAHRTSHGMKITADRLNIVNKVYGVNAEVQVNDIMEDELVAGTRVLLTLQYKTHDSNNS